MRHGRDCYDMGVAAMGIDVRDCRCTEHCTAVIIIALLFVLSLNTRSGDITRDVYAVTCEMVIDWIFNDVSVCVLHVVNFEPLSIRGKGSNILLSSLSHTGGECGVGGPLGLIPAQGVVGEWHTRALFTFLSADVPVSPLSLLMCVPPGVSLWDSMWTQRTRCHARALHGTRPFNLDHP